MMSIFVYRWLNRFSYHLILYYAMFITTTLSLYYFYFLFFLIISINLPLEYCLTYLTMYLYCINYIVSSFFFLKKNFVSGTKSRYNLPYFSVNLASTKKKYSTICSSISMFNLCISKIRKRKTCSYFKNMKTILTLVLCGL